MAVELTYFDGRGIAEIIRLTLATAGIKFDEVDLDTREQFEALWPDLLFNQVPLLRIDGLKLVQSNTIMRYIGEKANLLGKGLVEQASVTTLYEGSRDFLRPFLRFGFVSDDQVKSGIREKFFPRYLHVYEQILKQNTGSPYLVGSTLSIADLGLLEVVLLILEFFGAEELKDYPNLLKFHKTLAAQENIAKYMKDVRKPPNTKEKLERLKPVLLED